MKKIICWLLTAALALGACSAFAEEEIQTFDDAESASSTLFDEIAEDAALVPYDYDSITVGNPTPLNGQFFTDLWGNDTSDTDVKHLVTGYNLIAWDSEISRFRFDRSVVSGAMVSDDADGNRNYLITLYSDLFYSDGTPIQAWDYAFSVLLQCSPLIAELGGHPAVYDYLVGYEDYAAGKTPYIAGLRVPADNIIVFTVKQEALPYFYELSRIAFYPYPIQKIAPECRVYDDGDGAYIGSAASSTAASPFSVDLLSATILDPENGYMVHPDPSSGPYCIQSYDGLTAVFEINPFFKGNEEGKKPRIKRITYTVADNATMIEALGSGEYALLNKVAKASAITDGLRLCVDSAQYTRSTYPRVGLTYMYFNPESAPVQEQKVRQAIAYCFDRQSFIQDYVGAFGVEADGLYGLGQWMYGAATGSLAYPAQLPENATAEETAAYEAGAAAWDQLSLDGLTRYEPNIETAVGLLEEAGWTLNEQGEPFDPQVDSVRCRMVGSELRRLELTLGYQVGAELEAAFTAYFTDLLAQAGIRLTLVPLEFGTIVEAHNEHIFDSLDLLYFGDNFNISFDPALFFWGDDEAREDSLYAAYQELFALSKNMDHTEPADILGYMQKWILFQERLSQLLPLIPVYSNIYFDFYTRELDGYWIEENISWAKAIVPARMHSITTADSDAADVEIELSYARGESELELSRLIGRTSREAADYSSGALSRFPEVVRSQVPADYRSIYEFVAAHLEDEIDPEKESITMAYNFQTPYDEGETVYLLFGIPGKGSDVDWFVKEGTGLANGNIQVELEKAEWEKLIGVTFALAVVSK